MRRAAGVAVALLGLAGAAGAMEAFRTPADGPSAERIGTDARPAATAPAQEVPWDGQYTFARIRYGGDGGGLGSFGFGRREPVWAHDHPRAEENFVEILDELTTISPNAGRWRVLGMDDPEIFRYPVAYVVEVGFWDASQAEITALSAWLRKGGFLIVDDFRGGQITQFDRILRRAIPGSEILEVPTSHPVFDAFFRIDDPYSLAPPTFPQYRPMYLGIFEDNDPNGRLMVMMNYNNDIAEYWEISGRGWYPIDLENQAYKFGVNYVVYAMTH